MSRRGKRLMKKAVEISLLESEKDNIKAYVEQLQEEMEKAQMLIDQVELAKDELEEYVNKNENSQVFMSEHKLIDGTVLPLLVIQEGRQVIVSSMGLVASAKAHENDVFIFEIGYQLALNRVIEKYLNLICEYNAQAMQHMHEHDHVHE